MNPDAKLQIGMIGLGLMGTAMTERLLEHGYQVDVWNRTPEKSDPLIARGARWSSNPLADCNRVIISLYSSDIVHSVVESMLAELADRQTLHLLKGKIVIDTTPVYQSRA